MIGQRLLFAAVIAALGAAANAQVPPGPAVQSAPYLFSPLGYQQMPSLGVAIPLANIPKGAIYATVICSGQPIRWLDNGGIPTATTGNPLPINTEILLGETAGLSGISLIQTAASATCDVSYYK